MPLPLLGVGWDKKVVSALGYQRSLEGYSCPSVGLSCQSTHLPDPYPTSKVPSHLGAARSGCGLTDRDGVDPEPSFLALAIHVPSPPILGS